MNRLVAVGGASSLAKRHQPEKEEEEEPAEVTPDNITAAVEIVEIRYHDFCSAYIS